MSPFWSNLLQKSNNNETYSDGNKTVFPTGPIISCKISFLNNSVQIPYFSDRNTKKLIWEIYQTRVFGANTEGVYSEHPKNLIKTIQNLISQSKISHIDPKLNLEELDDLEKMPGQYLETVLSLKKMIKKIFFNDVQLKGQFVMNNNSYDENLDRAQRLIIPVITKIVHCYIEKNDLKEAIAATKKLKDLSAGSELFFEIAEIYFNKKEFDQVFNCLENIKEASKLGISFNKFIIQLVEAFGIEEVLERIENFSEKSSQQVFYPLLSDIFIQQKKFEESLNLIPEIQSTSTQDEKYKKLIDIYIQLERYDDAIDMIDNINSYNDQDREYKAIIDIYKKNDQLDDAVKLVKKINSYNDQDREYEFLIKIYMESEKKDKAKNVSKKINSSSTMEHIQQKYNL